MMRLGDLTDAELREAYAAPEPAWWRLNFVTTLDGAAQGSDGLSGTINNAADRRVFDLLRALSDCVVVGAGTLRAERYGAAGDRPLVVVSRSGRIPSTLVGASAGRLLMATCASSPGLPAARAELGDDHVVVTGEESVDPIGLRDALTERGLARVVCEGGPHLARDLLAAGVVDEWDQTLVPRLVAGDRLRPTAGEAIEVPLRLAGMLEEGDTLLMRWFVFSSLSGPLTAP